MHFRLFVYIGPVLMGIGCFLLVVATVIVCETRDKMLDIIDYRRRNPRDFMTTEPKPDFYRLVVSIGLPSNRRNQVLIEPSVVIDTALDNRSSCENANPTLLEETVNSRSDLFEDTPLRVEEFNLSTEAVPKQAKKPEYRPKISADPSRRFSARAVPLPMFGGRKQLRSASLDV